MGGGGCGGGRGREALLGGAWAQRSLINLLTAHISEFKIENLGLNPSVKPKSCSTFALLPLHYHNPCRAQQCKKSCIHAQETMTAAAVHSAM